MSKSYAKQVADYGQSLWYDNISRGVLRRGLLARMVDQDGIAGVTSNPTIFMKAIAEGKDYDGDIRSLAREGKGAEQIVHALMVGDIREAADALAVVHDLSDGRDGYVSLECDPHLAYDTAATVAEAERLVQDVGRPNLMIKVPGTAEGLPAARELLNRGINVNVTLLFSPEQYRRTAEAYVEALEARLRVGKPPGAVRSVASFFISRIDTVVDKSLDGLAAAEKDPVRREKIAGLRGRTAVAVAKVTYATFRELFFSDRFRPLQEAGAAVQRPLWASTGTKDPAYSDVKYVEALIGPHTVNTLPQATLEAFRDHGLAAETITTGLEEAPAVLAEVESLGISLAEVYRTLEADGVKAFTDSWDQLVEAVRRKAG